MQITMFTMKIKCKQSIDKKKIRMYNTIIAQGVLHSRKHCGDRLYRICFKVRCKYKVKFGGYSWE